MLSPPPKIPGNRKKITVIIILTSSVEEGGGSGGNAENRYQHVPVLKTFIFKIILIAKGGEGVEERPEEDMRPAFRTTIGL